MRRLAAILLLFLFSISAVSCGQVEGVAQSSSQPAESQNSGTSSESVQAENSPEEGILIAYFSLGRNAEYGEQVDASTSASLVSDGGELVGTTEYAAQLIQDCVGGDLYSIQTAEPYSTDFDTVIEENHAQAAAEELPELVLDDLDVSQYTTVFIGYPIWATDAPRAIYSFIAQYDLAGKRIVPFCTHDGYGAGSSYEDIANAVVGEKEMLEGLAMEASDVPEGAETVASWLQGLGLAAPSSTAGQTGEIPITITVDGTVLDGVLYPTDLAHEIRESFPLTVSMSGFGEREYYGGVDFYPQNLEGGQRTFENGHITYCEAHHNMAIFYAQTDDLELSVDVIPVGKVTSDLAVFETLPQQVEVTFALAEETE